MGGLDLACPFKTSLGKQQSHLSFVGKFCFGPVSAVGIGVVVIEFINKIPCLDAGIVLEPLKDSLQVGFDHRMFVGISEDSSPRALYPTAVVHSFFGFTLFAGYWLGVPHRVKWYKDDSYLMFLGDAEELLHAIEQIFAVTCPE